MKEKYDYEDLDRHFKEPKVLSPFYNVKRIPRKLRKKLRNHYWDIHCPNQEIGVLLWYLLGKTNPDYRRFLIKKVCEKYEY